MDLTEKFTKTEWTFENVFGRLIVTSGKRGFVIAEVTNKGIAHFIGNEEEAISNAKLIAAAPDLLKMCTYMLNDEALNESLFPTDREALQNAINKALL